MSNSTKCLLVSSLDAYSGKSSMILGLAHQLQQQGKAIAYGKPLGTCPAEGSTDQDVTFMGEVLGLSQEQISQPLVYLNPESLQKRITEQNKTDYAHKLPQYVQNMTGDIIFLEGPGTLADGLLFDLSSLQIAQRLNCGILLIIRYHSLSEIAKLLKAKQELGDRLLGVLLIDIPPSFQEEVATLGKPFLESQGIPVLGELPESRLLRSVSVREIRQKLGAEVLSRPDRLDLIVESLTIGAMNVNAALEYFRQGTNMAVVTGSDRTELQLAALETSTSCLILTGHAQPDPLILSRANELEVPILAVNLDTLTTVEIVDQTFGNVRLQEAIKVQLIQELMAKHFDLTRFLAVLEHFKGV